jgi:hypothetical protein
MSNKIKVAMICKGVDGLLYPAMAMVYANEAITAQIFAKTHAKQMGAVEVEFPTIFKSLPKKWQTWFLKRGVLDVTTQVI